MKKKLLLTLIGSIALCFGVRSQASSYDFSAVSGVYTAITGGTLVNTTIPDSYTSPSLTFAPGFVFAGVTYTNAYMTSNGLIVLGGTTAPASTQYNGISNTVNGAALCAFNADMIGSTASGATPNMRLETVGGTEHVFQWNDISRYPATTDRFSFQVRLNTTTGVIRYVYDFTSQGTSTSYQPIVGIRSAIGDYRILTVGTGAETWAAPNFGTSTTDAMRFTATAPVKAFTPGQTYIWTPKTCLVPPYSTFTLSNTSYSAATITWTNGSTESLWILSYGPPTTTLALSTPSYVLTNLTPSTDYTLRVRAYCGVGDTSIWTVVRPFRSLCQPPTLTSTTPGSVCVTGTVNLGATTQSSATINWYTVPVGGISTASTSVYTTPTISSTTTYYATTTGGFGIENMNSPVATSSSFLTTTPYGLYFTVNYPVTIASVRMFMSNATVGPASLQIRISDVNDNVVALAPLYNFTAQTAITGETVPLGISLPPGNYKIGLASYTGFTNLIRESGGVTFPYTTPSGALTITAGCTGTGATATTTSSYYWFYNWVLSVGCESPRTPVVATVNQRPFIIAVSSATGAICAGSSVNLVSAGGATSFTWTPSNGHSASINVSPLANTVYTVAGQTAGNCASTTTVAVAVNPAPVVNATAVNPVICSGETASITATGTNLFSYSWYPTGGIDATAFVTPTVSTIYLVTGHDALGCVGTASVQLTVNTSPALSAVASKTLVCSGDQVTLYASTDASSYVWSNSANTLSTNVTPVSTTNYSIFASNGVCTARAYIAVTVDACTSIAKQLAAEGISIYPNPVNDALTIALPSGSETTSVQIFDVMGKLVVAQTLSGALNSVNMSTLEKGVYFFKISDKNNEVKTGKVIKN